MSGNDPEDWLEEQRQIAYEFRTREVDALCSIAESLKVLATPTTSVAERFVDVERARAIRAGALLVHQGKGSFFEGELSVGSVRDAIAIIEEGRE